jgi:Na+-translocating ferredoxin:NAD+ oxidoreductase RnfC subunit
MHSSRTQVAEELAACIRCNECLVACPALPLPIPIETLNRETMTARSSPAVERFARACYQCGACVPVCPVGLHRDAMMLWLKMRLLSGDDGKAAATHSHSHGRNATVKEGMDSATWQ